MNLWFLGSCGLLLALIISSQLTAKEVKERYPIIPKPVSLLASTDDFILNDSIKIVVQPNNCDTKELASFIADFLSAPLGTKITIEDALKDSAGIKGAINIILDEHSQIAPEGYNLSVTPDSIIIKASSTTGAFWGFQTLRQLMPAQVEDRHKVTDTTLTIPCVTIKDFPRFQYRGLHLDVCRHMFPVEFIKKYIDLLSVYKLNTFHWHLTDDQGWRIEIKKYPKLQEIAAYRDETLIGHAKNIFHTFDQKRYGGFYTQNEVREVVEYARQRHVTIIPEIELPGHSMAALAAYPELGCTGGPYKTATRWGVFEDIYCAGNEKTFEFLEDVLTEVMSLFPSTYIHIGGDEAPKTRWKKCSKCKKRIKAEGLKDFNQLQSYFVRRIEKFLNAKNRQIIGWDEILDGGLAPNATVMSWRGTDGGIQAARLNHNVIMTPCQQLYLDYYQSKSSNEPLAIRGYTTLKKVYQYEPVPDALNANQGIFIQGAQANVWTEYMKTAEHVEYMTFPRAAALAELVWTPRSEKKFANFISRLKGNLLHLKALHVNYAEHALEE
jgi:hexosaminidase